ncbi:MAG: MmcQ/YjbR family DNA-binding protein [Acidobacteria bacterium]|nr:MmcQ/YjbR family DNA-binding protein [Acidobacteriota bacterium]MBK8149418.1 MmcQ/YjbR family DNA-binding protein [Acidobacteriota bacterium]MBK8813830.1 MmcQ/YjbR family DNA-binding protein [Acidobacteriota bacterium]
MSLTVEKVRELALGFEESVELPHFHLTSFRIRKKIFATIDVEKRLAMISLTPVEQSLFVDDDTIYPVPNAWGAKGATYFEIGRVRPEVFKDALRVAYRGKAPAKLAEKYQD